MVFKVSGQISSPFLCFGTPAFFSSYLAFKLVSNQKRSMFWSHIYESSMAFHLAGVALSELFLKKRVEFLVTPKGIQTDKRHFHLKTMIPHLIFFFALIACPCENRIRYEGKWDDEC